MPKPFHFFLPICTFIRMPRLYGTSGQYTCTTRLFRLWLSTVNKHYPKIIIPLHCAHSKMYTHHYLLVEQMHDRIHNFLTFTVCFWIPIFFSNLNSNCSNLLDLRNLHEQVKKAFCYHSGQKCSKMQLSTTSYALLGNCTMACKIDS